MDTDQAQTQETTASKEPEQKKGNSITGPDGVERTKKEHNKYMAKLKKQQKKQEAQDKKAKEEAEKMGEGGEEEEVEETDVSEGKYGDKPLTVSDCDPEIRN
jgi:lysyl-tRNA synthetase class II